MIHQDDETIGEFIDACLAIDNEEDARAFYEAAVAHIQSQIDRGKWESRYSPHEATRSNIGWCFGEGMALKRVRMWESVCQAAHPAVNHWPATPEEMFEAGRKLGERMRRT